MAEIEVSIGPVAFYAKDGQEAIERFVNEYMGMDSSNAFIWKTFLETVNVRFLKEGTIKNDAV